MIRFNSNDGKILSNYAKMESDKKIPMEFLLDGNFEEAISAYKTLVKQNPNNPAIKEDNLNRLGYDFLFTNKMKVAQDIFKVNMTLYPESFNAYDSYAET